MRPLTWGSAFLLFLSPHTQTYTYNTHTLTFSLSLSLLYLSAVVGSTLLSHYLTVSCLLLLYTAPAADTGTALSFFFVFFLLLPFPFAPTPINVLSKRWDSVRMSSCQCSSLLASTAR